METRFPPPLPQHRKGNEKTKDVVMIVSVGDGKSIGPSAQRMNFVPLCTEWISVSRCSQLITRSGRAMGGKG